MHKTDPMVNMQNCTVSSKQQREKFCKIDHKNLFQLSSMPVRLIRNSLYHADPFVLKKCNSEYVQTVARSQGYRWLCCCVLLFYLVPFVHLMVEYMCILCTDIRHVYVYKILFRGSIIMYISFINVFHIMVYVSCILVYCTLLWRNILQMRRNVQKIIDMLCRVYSTGQKTALLMHKHFCQHRHK